MVRHRGEPALVLDGGLWPWSFTGYGPFLRPSTGGVVEVLTPPASVAVLAAGYRPLLHPTVDRLAE